METGECDLCEMSILSEQSSKLGPNKVLIWYRAEVL